MGSKVGLLLCLLFAFAIMSSARNTFFIPGEDGMVGGRVGRSLIVSINDYENPSANRGHDPPSGRKGGGGGRRRRG